jgi:hypothetical protein
MAMLFVEVATNSRILQRNIPQLTSFPFYPPLVSEPCFEMLARDAALRRFFARFFASCAAAICSMVRTASGAVLPKRLTYSLAIKSGSGSSQGS